MAWPSAATRPAASQPVTWRRGRSPTGSLLSCLGPGAPAGPQGVSLGPLWEPVGVLPLQLEHALGVVEERLTRAVEERLLAGRVQVAELALQRFIVQLMRIKTELPRHGSPLPSADDRRPRLLDGPVTWAPTTLRPAAGHEARADCWSSPPSAYRALAPPTRLQQRAGPSLEDWRAAQEEAFDRQIRRPWLRGTNARDSERYGGGHPWPCGPVRPDVPARRVVLTVAVAEEPARWGERGRVVRFPDSLAAAQTARTSASRLTACSPSQQTAASHAAHACAAMSCAPSSRPAAL